MRSRTPKTPGGSSQNTRDEHAASTAAPEPQLAEPSWRWRLLFCAAIACAVAALAVAVMPELFLPAARATVPHLHP